MEPSTSPFKKKEPMDSKRISGESQKQFTPDDIACTDILDSFAVIAYLNDEEGADKVEEFLSKASKGEIRLFSQLSVLTGL